MNARPGGNASPFWELSTATHEIVDTIEWAKPSAAGYGGIRAMGLALSSPSVFMGTYKTKDGRIVITLINETHFASLAARRYLRSSG